MPPLPPNLSGNVSMVESPAESPMFRARPRTALQCSPELRLPAVLLARYLFFLSRRPISRSNTHYLERRIEGLRSLRHHFLGQAPELRDPPDQDGALPALARHLDGLSVHSLPHLAPRLQLELAPLLRETLAPDIVVSQLSPGEDFLRSVRKVLLVYGPAIGIGDEILTFALPGWLRQALPDCELRVLSGYRGLWDRVTGVDGSRCYDGQDEVLRALRGQTEEGRQDLVFLIDFEKPSLFAPLSFAAPSVDPSSIQNGAGRYVEVAIGARSAYALDPQRRRLYRREQVRPYHRNFYSSFTELMSWLGLPASLEPRRTLVRAGADSAPAVEGSESRPRPLPRATDTPAIESLAGQEALEILVSPFTSKHDPSEAYWSQLLARALPRNCARSLRLLFDPGPNLSTERFARNLARSTRSQAPTGVDCAVASPPGVQRTLSLDGVFSSMLRAQALICSDSFSAHAGPVFGCTTMVLAQPGLENWRVPEAPSFYFDANDALPRVALAMRQILDSLAHDELAPDGLAPDGLAPNGTPPATSAGLPLGCHRLQQASDRLRPELLGTLSPPELQGRYQELVLAGQLTIADPAQWPPSFAGLLCDLDYSSLFAPLPSEPAELGPIRADDLQQHISDRVQRWRNSNLSKLLELLLPATARTQDSRHGRGVAATADSATGGSATTAGAATLGENSVSTTMQVGATGATP